jgi:uncharacterized RDD family membrane protein YckC
MSDHDTQPPPPPPAGFPTTPPQNFPQPGYGTVLSSTQFASWIRRVGAYLLDYFLILPFIMIMVAANLINAVDKQLLPSSLIFILGYLVLLSILAITVYNRWYKGGQGQSYGKQWLGLTLVDASTGQPIGTVRAFARDLAHLLDSFICYVGWLFPLWDQKRQTIADKVLTTIVIIKP